MGPCTNPISDVNCTGNQVCDDPACPDNSCEDCFDYDKYCADCAQGSQDVCEECTEHDEVCQGCFDDCTSECCLPLNVCQEATCELTHDRGPSSSHAQYYGSHVVDMFGPPAWPSQCLLGSHQEHINPSFLNPGTSGGTRAYVAGDGHKGHQASGDGTSHAEAHSHPFGVLGMLQAPEATDIHHPFPHNMTTSLSQDPTTSEKTGTEDNLTAPGSYTASSASPSTPVSPNPSAVVSAAMHRDSALGIGCTGKQAVCHKIHSRVVVCQWADEAGVPCGRSFEIGDDMHEHLREAHSTKSEVFCRWIGCSVNAVGPHPHRYANSVQRHTWGHSGYRPYKCPACFEGFAAANIRDEHFSNIHLKAKSFCCDICNHQCTSATNLKRHKDDKHRAERFQCEFCNRHGKVRLFPRAPNLARHFRKCKYVLASFPEANGATNGKIDDAWYPPGYRKGHHGMDRAKVTPPKYLPT